MIELVVTACLLTAPTECRDHRLMIAPEGMTQSQCYSMSIPQLAQWKSTHERWRIKSWRCEPVNQAPRI